MPLTAWEGLKVVGHTIENLGANAEEFEDNNPDQKFKLSKEEIVSMVVELATALGMEVLD